jgi:hypothetical protein
LRENGQNCAAGIFCLLDLRPPTPQRSRCVTLDEGEYLRRSIGYFERESQKKRLRNHLCRDNAVAALPHGAGCVGIRGFSGQ